MTACGVPPRTRYGRHRSALGLVGRVPQSRRRLVKTKEQKDKVMRLLATWRGLFVTNVK